MPLPSTRLPLQGDPFHPAYARHVARLQAAGDGVGLGRLEAARAERQVGAEAARSWLRAAEALRAGGREDDARAAEDRASSRLPSSTSPSPAPRPGRGRRARPGGAPRQRAILAGARIVLAPTGAEGLRGAQPAPGSLGAHLTLGTGSLEATQAHPIAGGLQPGHVTRVGRMEGIALEQQRVEGSGIGILPPGDQELGELGGDGGIPRSEAVGRGQRIQRGLGLPQRAYRPAARRRRCARAAPSVRLRAAAT